MQRGLQSPALAAIALLSLAGCQTERSDAAFEAFDQLALGEGIITKRTEPARVVSLGGFDGLLVSALDRISEFSGLDIKRLSEGEEGANLVVEFGQAWPYAPQIKEEVPCNSRHDFSDRGELLFSKISISYDSDMRKCVVHELMHGFGFHGHTDGWNSVLDNNVSSSYTKWDEVFFQTLYDPRLKVGMPRPVALPIACEIINEILVIRDDLTDSPLNCAQLLAELADTTDPDAQDRMAYSYQNGLGVPQDYEKAMEWYTKAAAQGHRRAQKALKRLRAVRRLP